MAKTFVKVIVAILSVALGYGLFNFWNILRPNDDFMTQVGVGLVGFITSFISLYFLTKGGGD